jgi:hypothetical protein
MAAECEALLAKGADHEALVSFLREKGCFKLDSIAVLRKVLEISLGQAKGIVHCSATWSDVREADDRFHDALEQMFSDPDFVDKVEKSSPPI